MKVRSAKKAELEAAVRILSHTNKVEAIKLSRVLFTTDDGEPLSLIDAKNWVEDGCRNRLYLGQKVRLDAVDATVFTVIAIDGDWAWLKKHDGNDGDRVTVHIDHVVCY